MKSKENFEVKKNSGSDVKAIGKQGENPILPTDFINISKRIEHDSFQDWIDTTSGQWFQYLVQNCDSINQKNIVYLDCEFNCKKGLLTPILVCWEETKPPTGEDSFGHAWGGKAQRRKLLEVLDRADLIVAYNLFSFDICALSYWGYDVESNIHKMVDPYHFFFRYTSLRRTASLGNVSALNCGPEQIDIDNVDASERKRAKCENDVELLRHVFEAMMTGNVNTSRFGAIKTERRCCGPDQLSSLLIEVV